ncbi:MAG: SDR family NAD(P)-dependent oxidoreductase [Prolixibacteraceae bacterium]|nr:SDR family NAD(P)-dependent oxidoreductase [Prolixibacteraceae bacterium]
MARIFITGSADGLGQMAAKWLVTEGHQVVLHARNKKRGEEALKKVPGAENVLIADLSDIEETKQLAEKANATGRFDAIIHNAGVYQVAYDLIFAVNTLAPYILTCLIQKPKRLVYLSSGMHLGGNTGLETIKTGRVSYSDSKLHNVILSMAVARKWPDVYANAVDPGWVPTKMGGPGAPDNLQKGFETQAWLAVSNDNEAKVSGRYFYHKKQKQPLAGAGDIPVQEKFLELCEQITGIHFPADEQKGK